MSYYYTVRFFISDLVCVKICFFFQKLYNFAIYASIVYVFNFSPFIEDLHRKPSGCVSGLMDSQKRLYFISVLMNIGGGNDVLFCGELTGLAVVVLAVIWVSVSIIMSSLLGESRANSFLK